MRERQCPVVSSCTDYANLYFCARNPMMYKRKDLHEQLCVLRVSTDVLYLEGVVIADGNAASGPTAFWPAPDGLAKVDKELVFAEYWTDSDPTIQTYKKRVKCAEVLVPMRVEPQFIVGAYVSCERVRSALMAVAPKLVIVTNAHLFFY
ncbi:MAG: DUF4433 domain-containing protein [Anaerolineae bacterium]